MADGATSKSDLEQLPALGRALQWVDKPGSATLLFWLLAVLCAVLTLLDFAYVKHEKVLMANTFGFYAVFGFLAFTFIIFAAKALRLIIRRPEDYYGEQDINAEETPEHMLERKTHNGL